MSARTSFTLTRDPRGLVRRGDVLEILGVGARRLRRDVVGVLEVTMSAIRRDGPESTGASAPKPLEERYDYCTACTAELEPTRRAGGVCGPCMRTRMAARPALDAASSAAAEGRHHRRAGVSLAYGKGRPLRLVKR